MSPDKLAALRTFFSKIETRLPDAAALTYRRLLEAEPEAASLCKGDIREQQLHFMHKLWDIIKLTRSSHLWPAGAPTGQISIPEVVAFGRNHAKAGVTLKHFAVMKQAMAGACEAIAPEEFTPPVAEALAFILDVLAQSLSKPGDSADNVLSKLPCQNAAAVLHDPSAYFDEELPAVSAA
ncbi:MAG: hypothetical protein WCD20_12035 [Rhodomicrobium sp.]